MAHLVERLRREPIFPRVSFVYFNAWPEQNRGYNALGTMEERIRVLDRALEGMLRYEPDVILIACNTLSVLYPHTDFNHRKRVPVVDIIRFGVDLVYESFLKAPDARALLLGTVTTIASDLHRLKLIEKGVSPHKIAVQACDGLASAIERKPESETVRRLVDGCMDEAALKLGETQVDVKAALLCTHFGYIRNRFKASLEERISGKIDILDPNQRMADFLFETAGGRIHEAAVIDMRIVSKIVWSSERIDAVSALLEPVSRETAEALRRYHQQSHLF